MKTPTEITIRTFVGGDAYSAPLYLEITKTIASGAVVDKKYYLHRDYLGSIIAISDASGTAVERRQFDAWGNLSKLQKNGTAITLPINGTGSGLMMMDRGYTGHEHLSEVGLIQMNGRLYDPVLRSFLMPDNFIQEPENTQNYNRYSYVLNNPLMYTDPSGEYGVEVAVAVGIGIAALSYTMNALLTDVPFSVAELAKSVFVGALTSGCTFGIGEAAGSLFGAASTISKASFQALVHGSFQGMLSIEGGKFWSSFAAAAISSLAGSAFSSDLNGNASGLGWGSSVRDTTVGMVAFGTVSGGTAAVLAGGNFWQGAVTSLVVSGLNHAMHKIGDDSMFDDEYDQKGRKVTKASLGIKKGDTKEIMLDKTLRGMKVGDYISGDDASFLGEDAKTYIKAITRTGATTFSIDGDSNWVGVRAFKTGATMDISHLKKPFLLENGGKLSYKINIHGITTAGKAGNVYTVYYIGGNTSYTYFANGLHKIPN